jgi:hypothetical protein
VNDFRIRQDRENPIGLRRVRERRGICANWLSRDSTNEISQFLVRGAPRALRVTEGPGEVMALKRNSADPPPLFSKQSFHVIPYCANGRWSAQAQVMTERQDGYIVEHLIISTEETKTAPATAAKRKD